MSVLTRRMLWMGGAGVLLAWTIWFSRADELVLEDLPGRPTIPFEITEHLKLARDWSPFSRGSLRLACTSTKELRLVLQMLSPDRRARAELRDMDFLHLEAVLGVPGEMKMRVHIDGKTSHFLPFEKAFVASVRSVDTVVFEPFSPDEVRYLATWMDETWSKRFVINYSEYNVSMRGFTPGQAVLDLAHRCSAPS